MKIGHGRPELPDLYRRFLSCMPRFCCFCHRKTGSGLDICRFCYQHFPSIVQISAKKSTALCLRCGSSWPATVERQKCVICDKYQTAIERIVAAFRYGFPIDHLIGRLKYAQHLPTGHLLGNLLAEKIRCSLEPPDFPDCLLPVPLHQHRYCERGFNQSVEIARGCGAALDIPVMPDAVGRRFNTGSLAGLSRAERGVQIRGAFRVSDRLRGCSVAIVDDVLTTGATSGELATELMDSGVQSIQLWVVARTPVTGNDGGS